MTAVLNCFLILALVVVVQAGTPWIAEPHKGTESKHENLLNQTRYYRSKIRGIFLGDSITEQWKNNGKSIWSKHYEPRNVFNYGIGGDRTEHVLWRVQNGEFYHLDNCTVVVLMIGTNNIGANTPDDIAHGIRAILEALHAKMPKTKILLLSIFPRGGEDADKKVFQVNEKIKKFSNQRVHYLDVTENFEKGNQRGNVTEDLYVPDRLHLSEKGYQVWYESIETEFSKLLGH